MHLVDAFDVHGGHAMYNLGGVKLTCRSLPERENCERGRCRLGASKNVNAFARARLIRSVANVYVYVCAR